MFPIRSLLISSFCGSVLVAAQAGIPLYQKKFDYTNLPYQADTDTGDRGTQQGYNRCNSTTEGPTSKCQTAMINSIDDFCLWGPPEPNGIIGNTEGEAIAWCTKPGRGTRLIPAGALTGVQFMKTSAYVQVVGHINQSLINIQADDGGGEMDPHGADQRGNPLGGLLYSNAFPSNGGNNKTFQQVNEWHNFMGSNIFCLKACDGTGSQAAQFCEHRYDRIGCDFNAPAAYVEGTFESCEGETQDYPGVYTTNGQVMTFTQPAESLGPIATMPYTARVPKSSNCVAFSSAQIYTGLPSATGSGASASATPTGSSSSASVSGSGATTTPRATGTSTPSNSKSVASSTASATSSGTPSGSVRVVGEFGALGMLSALSVFVLSAVMVAL